MISSDNQDFKLSSDRANYQQSLLLKIEENNGDSRSRAKNGV